MSELIPAILAHDEATFRERLSLVEHEVETIHVDVMDGAFVPNRTWFDLHVLQSLQTSVQFEFHLMVQDPRVYIEKLASIKNTHRILWHIETETDHTSLLKDCHAQKYEAGLAISPMTPLDRLEAYVHALNEILIMGAEPGFSGQKLQPHTIERAREIHARWPTIPLGFDIDVNDRTIPTLLSAGITRCCVGSAIFDQLDPVQELQMLQKLIHTS